MRYFEKQKEEWLKSFKGFPSFVLPPHSLDGKGEIAINWAKKECGIDFSEYVHLLMREKGTDTIAKVGEILQDLMFQAYRVKAGI